MAAIVVLSVALAVMAVGMAVVAALHLRRVGKGLAAAAKRVGARLQPLTAELRDELAVTQAEVGSLSTASARRGSTDLPAARS